MQPRIAPLSDQPLGEVLESLSARTPGPGAGSAAALACAVAASLVEMAARFDVAAPAPRERAASARGLRERALAVADAERDAYAPVLEALALPADAPERATRVASALSAASEGPLTIAAIAAEITGLAAGAARDGNRHLIGEAAAAAELADGACRAAADLVAINLQDAAADARRTQVAELVSATARALETVSARVAELSEN